MGILRDACRRRWAIFAPWEHASDPPQVVWQDIERIHDHYAWSVDYAVEVTQRYWRLFARMDLWRARCRHWITLKRLRE